MEPECILNRFFVQLLPLNFFLNLNPAIL